MSDNISPFLDVETKSEHRANNFFHTVMLLSGLGFLMLVCGWILSGFFGAFISILFATMIYFLAPRLSGKMVMRMYRAKPLDEKHGADFNRILEILSDRAELPVKPELYIIPSSTLNAFATGSQQKPYIAMTEGLLRALEKHEIAGVMAHEISHIRNEDLATMAIADSMSRVTQSMSIAGLLVMGLNLLYMFLGVETFSWMGAVLLYLAPTFGSLLQLALSRTREFDADLEGASLIGDPSWLASALQKLENYHGAMWEDMLLPGRRIPQPSLLRSHPPTEERVERLNSLAPALPPITIPNTPMITMVGMGPATLHPKYHFPWPGIWY